FRRSIRFHFATCRRLVSRSLIRQTQSVVRFGELRADGERLLIVLDGLRKIPSLKSERAELDVRSAIFRIEPNRFFKQRPSRLRIASRAIFLLTFHNRNRVVVDRGGVRRLKFGELRQLFFRAPEWNVYGFFHLPEEKIWRGFAWLQIARFAET